jgi:hypothetical protein
LVGLNRTFPSTGTICRVLTYAENHMSLAVLRSRALAGMEAPAVSVEVHLANGLPGLTIAGTNTPNLPAVRSSP